MGPVVSGLIDDFVPGARHAQGCALHAVGYYQSSRSHRLLPSWPCSTVLCRCCAYRTEPNWCILADLGLGATISGTHSVRKKRHSMMSCVSRSGSTWLIESNLLVGIGLGPKDPVDDDEYNADEHDEGDRKIEDGVGGTMAVGGSYAHGSGWAKSMGFIIRKRGSPVTR